MSNAQQINLFQPKTSQTLSPFLSHCKGTIVMDSLTHISFVDPFSFFLLLLNL
jgi:hypothetical protein